MNSSLGGVVPKRSCTKLPLLRGLWLLANCKKIKNKRALLLYTHLGNYCARWACYFFNGSVLIHFPFGFSSSGRLPFIENHGFLHSNHPIIRRIHIARRACCFPVPRNCSSAWSSSPSFSLLSWRKEKPLLSISSTHLSWNLCKHNKQKPKSIYFQYQCTIQLKLFKKMNLWKIYIYIYTYLEGARALCHKCGPLG